LTAANHLTYRPDIDGLRAVAVLSVLMFHAFPKVSRGGFVGVDVFFVISGFLISSIILKALEQNTFSYTEFYARRIRRIFPALMLMLGACLLFGWFALTPNEYKALGRHAAAGALFVSNLALWREAGYFDHDSQTKALLHLWSLGIEEQFYIVWPLCLAWLRKIPLTLVGIICLSFAANVLLVGASPDAAFYAPFTRFWELALGAFLAQLTLATPWTGWLGSAQRLVQSLGGRPVASDALSIAGLLLVMGPVLGLSSDARFPGWWASLPVLGAFGLIAAGPRAVINRRLLSTRPLVFVGYPLYLWHWPMLVGLRLLDLSWLPAESRLAKAGAVTAAFVLASLTHRQVELRVRRARGVVPVLCASALAVLLACGAVVWSDGAGTRFSDAQQRIASVAAAAAAAKATEYRASSCFLDNTQSGASFKPECTRRVFEGSPTVLLWGDSHAAHLYQGLRSLSDAHGFNLAQLTAGRCPPFIGYSAARLHPHCANINQHVLEWAADNRPRTVILAANWPLYKQSAVVATLDRLRALSIEQIVVVGPVAMFARPQSELLIRHTSGAIVPERLVTPRFPELKAIDELLRRLSAEAHVEFVSVLDKTCSSQGCIVAAEGRPELLLSFDQAHLTRAGSNFVVARTLCELLAACGAMHPVAGRLAN